MDAADHLAEADRAMADGDGARAVMCMRQAVEARPDDAALWLRLAGAHRAMRQPHKALEATKQALRIAPLDFVALAMNASLLERIEPARAGRAWAQALAQTPSDDMPPALQTAAEQGAALRDAWIAARDVRMGESLGTVEERANNEELQRIARFKSNILRRTRHYHSEPTDFHFSGLSEREFHPRRLFAWLGELEAATDLIVAELQAVMTAERAELVPYIQYEPHLPLRQWESLNHSRDWTAIHLWQNGRRVDANARHCPRTMALLNQIGQPIVTGASPNAMFSLLAPGTTIPPHVGVSNARLVCHLPLIVPADCWFRVGAETRAWEPGRAFVFDDTIEHEAANPSDELRVVLIFDVWHPDLSNVERDAVAALVGAEGSGAAGGL